MSSQKTGVIPKLVLTNTETDIDIDLTTGGMGLGAGGFETDVETSTTKTEFTPLVVTRFGGTLPWDTQSRQLQCGETVTTNDGDMNIQLVYECICTLSQLETLQTMRESEGTLRIVSTAYRGSVTFDQMKFDRVADANGQITRDFGDVDEPTYEVQLQTKELSEN